MAEDKENRITKTAKFYIYYLGEMPYLDLCRELWDCQEELRHVLNAASTEFRIYSEWRESVKNERGGGKGRYPSSAEVKEHYGCDFQTFLYRVATGFHGSRSYTQKLGSEVITASIHGELEKWKKAYLEYMRGERAYPSYKANQPLVISKRKTELFYNENGERIIVFQNIIGDKRTKELGLKDSKMPFRISAKDEGTNSILDSCINGAYEKKARQSVMIKRKKRGYVR